MMLEKVKASVADIVTVEMETHYEWEVAKRCFLGRTGDSPVHQKPDEAPKEV